MKSHKIRAPAPKEAMYTHHGIIMALTHNPVGDHLRKGPIMLKYPSALREMTWSSTSEGCNLFDAAFPLGVLAWDSAPQGQSDLYRLH